ncbi:Permease of the drug/metabolite transporter [Collimonas arenae]|uniref:Permease of the drug/metabolite transporter n=1 Tax=Collimonas arenae TaxID=279058 RepID=A0A0A1FH80_9BURK|nr:hypothetical protein [Collimonas arenae]AIY44138.1 Permease of the drug/metabolite transporter [Collimonas arenae]
MIKKIEPATQSTSYYFFLIAIGMLSIYFFFYQQINSHFSWIFGGDYDAVIEAVLVSHWYRVFEFNQAWNQPLYFYPYQDILGYNDGYFLYGVIGIPYRLLGFDLLVTQELVHMTVKAIGFLSMATLLGRLQQKNIIALLGAALFTLFLSSSARAEHAQLFSVAFLPLLAFLLLETVQSVFSSKRKAMLLYSTAFSLLYGAMLITGFYMAWFFGLFLIICIIFYAYFDFGKMKTFFNLALSSKWQIVLIASIFLFAIAPFLYVYLPKLKETGGQGYDSQIFYSLHYLDILNYGKGSLLWGRLFEFIDNRFPGMWRPGEYQVGFTPDVFILAIFIIFSLILKKTSASPRWFKVLACATLLAMLLPLSFSGHSLWFFVRSLVPGGRGLRVIARFYIFLAFPVSILIAVYFSNLWTLFKKFRMPIFALLSLVCLGQINVHKEVGLEVKKHMAMVNNAAPSSKECTSFFVTNPVPKSGDFISSLYGQNVQAMLLSDTFGIPTLNGFATFNPPDWIFEDRPMYVYRVGNYVSSHNLQGVCEYDIGNNKWLTPGEINYLSETAGYQFGEAVSFSKDGTGEKFILDGWSPAEDWGRWTGARTASLIMRVAAAEGSAIDLEFNSRAFLVPTHQTLNVLVFVNDQKLGTFKYQYPLDAADSVRTVKIPGDLVAKSKGLLKIEFEMENPVSPASLGLSADSRNLGLGLTGLALRSSSSQ